MKISILIPCHNEELTIKRCLESCLKQTRPADEIIIVDDSSTDKTPEILKQFGWPVKVVKTAFNTGNKSYAQEFGLKFITGDVYIATDGDTVLDKNFVEIIEKDMQDEKISAVAGYVKSLKYNWVTASRALDYAISQNIDKLAQAYIGFIFVIPGAAGAFRTKVFKENILFTHDTITEDLDFTYRLNKMGRKIKYNRRAICYTQDPPSLKAYINQMRRWFGGGWQNIKKHITIPNSPGMALELTLIYVEGLIFSFVLFLLPLLNFYMAAYVFLIYLFIVSALAFFGSYKEKRFDLMLALPGYIFLRYVNSYVFIEQFFKEIIFRKKNLRWFKPDRVDI
ncbi:MAG: glycosyltransferase family 2 protein [Candidatus Staskawiczbacteria bacterium]|nr:glycosyltransferase family 2 protein [Candidatus Staskawiczbacteria bacterium]